MWTGKENERQFGIKWSTELSKYTKNLEQGGKTLNKKKTKLLRMKKYHKKTRRGSWEEVVHRWGKKGTEYQLSSLSRLEKLQRSDHLIIN